MNKIIWERYSPREQHEALLKEMEDEPWSENTIKLPFVNSPEFPEEYYIAHCSFRLTKYHLQILNFKIDGLEHCKIISPYRFSCAVAKCFDCDVVKQNIESSFGVKNNRYAGTKIEEDINLEKEKLKDYKNWCIFVFPNGKIISCKEDSNTFEQEKENMRKLSQTLNGILIES